MNSIEFAEKMLLIVVFVILICMSGRSCILLEKLSTDKTLRVTKVIHQYDIKSYGTVNLPGEYKGTHHIKEIVEDNMGEPSQ
jgi:hypothetical protein